MQKQELFLFIILFSLIFSSCEKEPVRSNGSAPDHSSKALLVGNEGSFGTNTASVSVINLDDNTVSNHVFRDINNQALGDVLQSIERIGAYYYFVVNNSNKIVVTDTNFALVTEINNITSPRFIKQVSSTKAYVSSLFTDKMYVIDLLSNTKVTDIQMNGNWTEQMLLRSDATGQYVYVCENDTSIDYITKISVSTNQIIDKITISGVSPSKIGTTSDGHIWVLSGNNYRGKESRLTEVDPSTNQQVQSFVFPNNYTMIHMAIGPNDEKYITTVDYSTNAYGVYKFEKNTQGTPNNFFLSSTSAFYYGVTIDPTNGDVYISDTKGFTQAGAVNRYSNLGVLLNSWTTAIGPGNFHFAK